MYLSRNDLWMNEWMMHLYNALLCIAVHPKRFTIMWGGGGGGVSPQPSPVCSIHLDDATVATWHLCQCAHHTNYRWRGERVVVMYILLNKYFCCTVFKKTWLLFWRVAVNTFTFLCVYDMRIVLLKWNGETLIKWLSEQFWIEMHRLTGQWSESSNFAHDRPGSVTGWSVSRLADSRKIK